MSLVQNPVVQGPKTLVEGFSGNIADVDNTGALKVSVTSGGGSNASVASTGGSVPASATLVGGSESGVLQPVSLDPSGNLNVNVQASVVPAGVATSAKQDTGNTSLASIDTKTPALSSGRVPVDGSGVTQPVSAASLPLPTGAAQDATLTGGSAKTQSQSFGWTRLAVAAWTSATTINTTVSLLNNVWSYNLALFQIEVSGTATGWSIAYEFSLDGVTWDTVPLVYQDGPVVNPVISQSERVGNISGYPFVRARLASTITGSGTVTINVGFQSMGQTPTKSSVTPIGIGTLTGYCTLLGALDSNVSAQALNVVLGTNNLQVDVTSVNGGTTATVGTGIQKVGVVGHGAGVFDGVITAAAAPANGVPTLSVNQTTAPSLTTGQSVAVQSDYQGSVFVKPYRRGQTKGQGTTLASTSSPTTVVTGQAAGIFADISSLILTVTPAATTDLSFTAILSDGTNSYTFDMDTGALATATATPTVINCSFDPPLPATTAATAWTLQLSVSTVTVHCTIVFVLQKAS